MATFLGLSPAMSAVTLIALANGAGDVITAIVSSTGPGGINYNIGALYGAGLFCCSLVIALSVLSSDIEIQVETNTIYRDLVFYILATIMTLVFAAIG